MSMNNNKSNACKSKLLLVMTKQRLSLLLIDFCWLRLFWLVWVALVIRKRERDDDDDEFSLLTLTMTMTYMMKFFFLFCCSVLDVKSALS
jgi:hypothetical protein